MRPVKEICEQAFALQGAGDLDAAEQIYDQLLGQLEKPDPNVLFGYGTLLAQKQRYGLGSVLLKWSISLYPNHAASWANLGCALKFTGQDERAMEAYQRAIALEPEQPD